MRRDRLLGASDLGGRHLREVLALEHLAVGHGEAGIDLDLALLAACSLSFRLENSASWMREEPACGFWRRRLRLRQTSSPSAGRDSRACGRRS